MSKAALTEEERELDPYKLLEVEANATAKDIQRAYRKKSLKYHPDKNSTPEAGVMFHQLSLSLSILMDPAKRTYVDTKMEKERAQRARYAEMSKKRQADVDDLVRREEEAKRAKSKLRDQRKAAAEEESIREAGRQLVEQAQKRAREKAAAASAASAASTTIGQQPVPSTSQIYSTSSTFSNSTNDPQPNITSADLTLRLQLPTSSSLLGSGVLESTLKARYGSISHVIVREPAESGASLVVGGDKKKKKSKGGMAIVEFAPGNWGGCWACMRDHEDIEDVEKKRRGGRKIEDGVKAKWITKVEPDWVGWAERQAALAFRSGNDNSVDANENLAVNDDNSSLGTNINRSSITNNQRPLDGSSSSTNFSSAPKFSSAPDFSTSTSNLSIQDLVNRHAQSRSDETAKIEKKKREERQFESVTLMRMRQMERERLEEEIRRQEDAEEEMK